MAINFKQFIFSVSILLLSVLTSSCLHPIKPDNADPAEESEETTSSPAAAPTISTTPVLQTIANSSAQATVAITAINANDTSGGDTDSGGNPLTYSCRFDNVLNGFVDLGFTDCNSATGMSFSTSTGILSWTPQITDFGNFEFEIYATNTVYGDSEMFTISVTNSFWPFDTPANYTYNSNYIDVSAGVATLKSVDTIHNSAADFALGTHLGTEFSSGVLTLNETSSAISELEASWTPQHANIVGYWRLNEVTAINGSTISATVGTDGTLVTDNGLTSKSTTGQVNGALTFDGTSDYVSVGSPAALRPTTVSMSAWVKLSALPSVQFIGGYGNTGNLGYWLGTNSTTIEFNAGDGVTGGTAARARFNFNPNLGEWYHLVGTKETNSIKLYINGVLYNENTSIIGAVAYGALADGFIIGNTEGYSGARYFNGDIDEVAVWNSVLTSEEVSIIYLRQKNKFAGFYNSPIIDLGTSGSWTDLTWITSLPFGKELPGSSGNELTSNYSGLVDSSGTANDSSLFLNLEGLWHFNETIAGTATGGADYLDSSDPSSPGIHLTRFSGSSYSEPGFINNSLTNASASHSDILDFIDNSPYTWCGWVSTTVTSNWYGILSKRTSAPFEGYNCTVNSSGILGCNRRAIGSSGSSTRVEYSTPVNDGSWNHFCWTYDGRFTTLFVNGSQVDRDTDTAPLIDNSIDLVIGETGAEPGSLDELAVWSRALHSNEVLELYRRGSNRVKYQIRSCDDALCAGDAWIGPDGTDRTYFSELHNCSSISGATGECDGTVNLASASLRFSDFVSAPANNQYFQYRAILESDDEAMACSGNTCLPSISSIEIAPTGRYVGGSPTIRNNTPVAFTTLSSMSATASGDCSITYQISNDNVTYYYHNGVNWTAAVGAAQTNSLAVINANIGTFVTDVAVGNFYFMAYLNSDTTQSCVLEELGIVF